MSADWTEGEARFLRAYRRTLDAAAAFRESGLPGRDGWGDRANGSAILRRLKGKMEELEGREAELNRATLQRVKDEIAHIAFDDIGRYLSFKEGADGFEVHPVESGFLDTRSIAEVSVGAGGKVSLKLYSKERALFKLYEILAAEGDGEEDGGLLEALMGIEGAAQGSA